MRLSLNDFQMVLRIFDLYENNLNKQIFGQFLNNCLKAKTEGQVIKQIITLDNIRIIGLGQAVASIIYFPHPTFIPTFNIAINNQHAALSLSDLGGTHKDNAEVKIC